MHYAYFVRCADGTLYAGYAREPRQRELAHNSGRGARYTSGRRPVTLVYAESFRSKGAALRREHQLKRLSRAKKEALIRVAPCAAGVYADSRSHTRGLIARRRTR